jgi:solute carrier family 35 protein F1/2
MENKNVATKVTGVETYERHVGESYSKSSDGLEGNGNGSGSLEMAGQRVVTNPDEEIDPEILEHAIQALENKKTAWWAYLTTRDFWLVLLIGYVHPLLNSRPKTNL